MVYTEIRFVLDYFHFAVVVSAFQSIPDSIRSSRHSWSVNWSHACLWSGSYSAVPCLGPILLHGCDLHSLTPSFVQEWFPNLHQTLVDWKSIDISSGDSIDVFDAHFQLYHDFSVIFFIKKIVGITIIQRLF